MLLKSLKHLHDVFLYIQNRITAGVDPDTVAIEVVNRFSTYWVYKVSPEELYNIIHMHCLQAYLYINKCMYGYEEDAITRRKA